MNILTIETTCDETAAAVVSDRLEVLGAVVASQDELHERFGGVVPEIASRAHVERILPVIDEALRRAGVALDDLDAVAVANTPGLAGSLLVGLAAAKGIAATLDVPLVGYDHIAAHLYACRLARGRPLPEPCLGLVASGGHTSLFRLSGPLELERLGGTIDDAVGEAFDKAAAILGLGYPGGPEIEREAAAGDPRAYRLPRPLAADRTQLNVSFSGLKTALRYLVRPPGSSPETPPPEGKRRADLAASFQQAAIDSIMAKVELAVEQTGCRAVAVGGGVAANTLLRERLEDWSSREGIDLVLAPKSLCTDNAAMGAIAWERLERGENDGLELDVRPGTDRIRRA